MEIEVLRRKIGKDRRVKAERSQLSERKRVRGSFQKHVGDPAVTKFGQGGVKHGGVRCGERAGKCPDRLAGKAGPGIDLMQKRDHRRLAVGSGDGGEREALSGVAVKPGGNGGLGDPGIGNREKGDAVLRQISGRLRPVGPDETGGGTAGNGLRDRRVSVPVKAGDRDVQGAGTAKRGIGGDKRDLGVDRDRVGIVGQRCDQMRKGHKIISVS